VDEFFRKELGIDLNFGQMIQFYALLLARITPAIFQTPFLGGEIVQGEMKVGISMILVVFFYPAVVPAVPQPLPAEVPAYVMLLIKEFFVGFVMGFLAALPFNHVNSAGNQMDNARGASQGQIQNPGVSEEVTLMANFMYWLMVFLFLAADGHHMYIRGLGRSFSVIPLTSMPAFELGFTPFVSDLVRLTAEMFVLCVQLSAPVIIVCLVTDVVFGLFNRIAAQMQVGELSQTVKLLVGLWVFFVSLPVLVRQMYKLLDNMLVYSVEMLTKL
jgi:type III secretory pathway component EscT